jgi:LemA protein
MKVTTIFLLAGIAAAAYLAYAYNLFVKLNARAKSAWADIDVQLKRRHDLVPNLVTVVKGYALHERTTLEAVTAARSAAIAAGAQPKEAENALSGTLKSLFALVENYPNLKADGTFLQLHKELVDIEDTLQYARRYYNGVVRDFNTAIAVFPNNAAAALFGFKAKYFFELESVLEKPAPQVDLGR